MNTLRLWFIEFDGRSLRERVLIVVTVLVLIWGLWFTLYGAPVLDRLSAEQSALKRLTQELQTLVSSNLQTKADPSKPLVAQRDALRAQVLAHQADLAELLDGYVQPAEVADLLRAMLETNPSIEMRNLRNLPGEEVRLGTEPTGVFRHRVELELSGDFRSIVAYLQSLEAYTDGLRWYAVHYVVEQHPQAVVKLQVETLSHTQAWVQV